MFYRTAIMVVGLVSCVMSAEPPVSPWQALNPALASPVQYSDIPQPQPQYEPTRQDEKSYLSPEEEFLINNMPFKLPFKMEKKQIAVAMKLLKEAAKPVVKSKVLRESVAYLDEVVRDYVDDQDAQVYMTFVLDSLQDLYEGKEATQFHKFMRGFFSDLSGDEQTARSIDGVFRSTMQYVYNPVRNYFRNYLVDPLTSYVNGFAKRIGTWMGNDRSYVGKIHHPENYESPDNHIHTWSNRMSSYARSFSDWTRQARMGLEVAARMLEVEDQRSCGGSCGTKPYEDTNVSLK